MFNTLARAGINIEKVRVYLRRFAIDEQLFSDVVLCLGIMRVIPFYIVNNKIMSKEGDKGINDYGDISVLRVFSERELDFILENLEDDRGRLYNVTQLALLI